MLFPFLTFASLGWLLLLIPLGIFLIIYANARDSFSSGFSNWTGPYLIIWFLVLFAIFFLFSSVPIFSFIYTNWLYCILAFVGYFLFGTLWSIIRWIVFYLPERVESYNLLKNTYLNDYAKYVKINNDQLDYKNWLQKNKDIPPSPVKNKPKITFWMTFWPFDLVDCFLTKFIVRIVNFIYNKINNIFVIFANKAFSSSLND